MRFHEGLINSGDVVLGGDATIYGPVNGGDITVLSDSEATIVGDLLLSGSSVLGLTIGTADGTLDVIGSVDLGGATLELDYSAGVQSQPGDSYAVLSSSSPISGAFGNTQVVADGRLWDISGLGTETIFVTATISTVIDDNADFDNSDLVDSFDFFTWQRNYSTGTTFAQGDANLDGTVDGLDLAVWQDQFGTDPNLAALAAAAVPEPSSGILVSLAAVLATAGLSASRRRYL